MTGFVPKAVKTRADELGNRLNHRPALTTVTGERWRITVTSPRVKVVLDFKLLQRGRLRQMPGSTLHIDGQRVEIANDLDELAAIFADPDMDRLALRQGIAAPPSNPTTTGCPDDAPQEVQQAFHLLASKLPSTMVVHASESNSGVWTVAVDHERVSLRVRFKSKLKRRPGSIRYVPGPLQLWVDGIDRSEEVQNKIDKAIEVLLSPGDPPPSPSSIGTTSPARTTETGVTVRHTTVLRR